MKDVSSDFSLFYIARCARGILTLIALLLRSACGDPLCLAVTDSVGVLRLYKASDGAAWTLEASFQLQALPFAPEPHRAACPTYICTVCLLCQVETLYLQLSAGWYRISSWEWWVVGEGAAKVAEQSLERHQILSRCCLFKWDRPEARACPASRQMPLKPLFEILTNVCVLRQAGPIAFYSANPTPMICSPPNCRWRIRCRTACTFLPPSQVRTSCRNLPICWFPLATAAL